MENLISINDKYNSLDKLKDFLQSISDYECTKDYDAWEHRVDDKGHMEQCLILKKSNMHAVKLFFVNKNTVKVNHIIPNKVMQAYFGKSVKARQNIIEIITGKIKEVALASSQQKAFEELESVINKAS